MIDQRDRTRSDRRTIATKRGVRRLSIENGSTGSTALSSTKTKSAVKTALKMEASVSAACKSAGEDTLAHLMTRRPQTLKSAHVAPSVWKENPRSNPPTATTRVKLPRASILAHFFPLAARIASMTLGGSRILSQRMNSAAMTSGAWRRNAARQPSVSAIQPPRGPPTPAPEGRGPERRTVASARLRRR